MTPIVYLVDDDDAVRHALQQLLEVERFAVRSFSGGEAFLAGCVPDAAGCLVLDVRMPGMSGPALHAALRERGYTLPVIYLTGHGDVPTSVRAMLDGAFDFLEKPPADGVLVARVRAALERDAEQRRETARVREICKRHALLTPRERDVFENVVAGRSNKETARVLGISHRTVDVYRQRIMAKMQATNPIELAELAHLVPEERRVPAPSEHQQLRVGPYRR